MKVAHLDTGLEWRGGQNQIALLLDGLAARGVESVLLAPRGPLLEHAARRGVRAHAWHARGDLDLIAIAHARRLLRAERPDVVHLHSARAHAVGVPAARLAGVGAVVASRRVAFPARHDPLSRLKYRMPVDRWLCVSEAARRSVIEAGADASRAIVVPSGVDLEALAARAARGGADLRDRLGLAPPVPLLATVASLTAEKRHALLLEAAVRLAPREPAAHWVWIGDGPLRASLERERERHGLADRVHLLGHSSEVPALVKQCTLLVVASRHEGFCSSAVEAQALGLPVVATHVGGLPEAVVDGETGILVPPEDSGAMAAAIDALIDDPARRERLGARGRVHAAQFSAARMVEGTQAAYQDVVRSAGATR